MCMESSNLYCAKSVRWYMKQGLVQYSGILREPDVWCEMIQGHIIRDMWEDPMTRNLVEEASLRCPDLGRDIGIITQ